MATDATGTPTTLGIPTLNTAVDAPTGNGTNAAMTVIDTLIQGRIASPAGIVSGEFPVYNGTTYVRSTVTKVGSASLAGWPWVNADIDAAAAIAYSKLNLTGNIVNADVSASAAIAYSKLALTGTIVNADISGSAAIALSKISGAAPLASPTFTGTPAGPTAAPGTNTTQLATTAYVQTAIGSGVVNTFNGRSGTVVPASADYTAAQVTNAADKSSSSVQSFTGGLKSAHSSTGIGYATGAGGAVTQATSRTTAVTLNTVTGTITTHTQNTGAAPTTWTFTVNNSSLEVGDTVHISWQNPSDPADSYQASAVAAGSFKIAYTLNTTSNSTTAYKFNYAIVKAVSA